MSNVFLTGGRIEVLYRLYRTAIRTALYSLYSMYLRNCLSTSLRCMDRSKSQNTARACPHRKDTQYQCSKVLPSFWMRFLSLIQNVSEQFNIIVRALERASAAFCSERLGAPDRCSSRELASVRLGPRLGDLRRGCIGTTSRSIPPSGLRRIVHECARVHI
jgi:hypothetical protein